MTVEEIRAQAGILKGEASQKLCRLFDIAPGESNGTVERIVECIVSAAMLEITACQSEAMGRSRDG